MANKILLALFGVLILALVWMLFECPAGYKQREKAIVKVWQMKVDSTERAWKDSLHHESLRSLEVFSGYAKALDRMTGDRDYWKGKVK